MATAATGPAATSATGKSNRGKDQLNWPADRWTAVDAAVTEEMARTRVAAKFLKVVHVPKNLKTVPADVVVTPTSSTPVAGAAGSPFDPALSVSETVTVMVQQPSVEYYLTSAQNDDEASEEVAMSHGQGASTFFSLSLRAANILAQVEDLLIHNGRNAFWHPLLTPPYSLVQFRDKTVGQDLDLGLAQIAPTTAMVGASPPKGPNVIMLPVTQVVQVPPSPNTPPGSGPAYLDQVSDAFVKCISVLNLNGYYENYFAVVHQYIKADMSRSLTNTFVTALEPLERLFTAGIYGGIMPPFVVPAGEGQYGLPTQISGTPSNIPIDGTVLYTGVVGSLSGNSMDLVRGNLAEDCDATPLDAAANFLSVDSIGNYRFGMYERFAFRLKDPNALVLLLFMDFPAEQLVFTVQPGNTTAGSTIPTFTVQVQDGNGHVVTSSTLPVTIKIGTNPAGGTLSPAPGSSLTVDAVAGVATLSGLSINDTGDGYTLVATSTDPQAPSSGTSASFNIG